MFNVDYHTDTNESNSTQYQSKYVHVNKFAPLAVDDDSFAFDTKSSVDKLGDVDAQVVETRAEVKSKCHKKCKKNSVNQNTIDGGLVKGHVGRDLDADPHISTQVYSEIHETNLSKVSPLVITSIDSNYDSSATREITNDKYCLEITTTQTSQKM